MSEPLDDVLALEAKGLFLPAHDRAMAALTKDGVDDDRLRHRAVLTLARAGATAAAIALFRRFALSGHRDTDIATLEGRLLKDLARAAPPAKRAGLAGRSAKVYERIWQRSGEAYHGVNAAAMLLVAGERERTDALIATILRAASDDGSYWAAANMAEAHLLAGNADAARRWLEVAETRAGENFASRAVTRRQLRMEALAIGIDPAIVDALKIPATAHFCGHMLPEGVGDEAARAGWEHALAARMDASLAQHDVRFAYGALAGGADILFAEALLRRGAELNVVLPFDTESFIRRSVLPCGPGWVQRFEACLARAGAPVIVGFAHYPHDNLDFSLAARYAMGQARLRAQNLDGDAWQLAVWDGAPAHDSAGTAVDVETWRAAGGRTINLGCPWPRSEPSPVALDVSRQRRAMSVLFSDLPGFGALDDVHFTAFYGGPMVATGGVLDRYAPAYRNSWGDAVQLVFDSPDVAAACAFDMLIAFAPQALAAVGLPETLVPRLALDFGPVLAVTDEVQKADKFAGRVMTRAARIEPVTPPGQIYATEAFACEIALDSASPFRCEYAGRIPTAKGFGVLPLYAVAGRPSESAADSVTLGAPSGGESAPEPAR